MSNGWFTYRKPQWKIELDWYREEICKELHISDKELDHIIETLEHYKVLYH